MHCHTFNSVYGMNLMSRAAFILSIDVRKIDTSIFLLVPEILSGVKVPEVTNPCVNVMFCDIVILEYASASQRKNLLMNLLIQYV